MRPGGITSELVIQLRTLVMRASLFLFSSHGAMMVQGFMSAVIRYAAIGGAVLLAGCNSIQLGYNYAPALLQYQMDSYLDLNEEQETLLSQELKQFQAWHRAGELPIYAQTLRQWAKKLEQPYTFTTDELLAKHAELEGMLLKAGEQSAFHLAPLVLTLSQAQRDRLRAEFEQSNEEYAEEFLADGEQAAQDRLERFQERYEEWLGPLTKAQDTRLRQWLSEQPSRAAQWGEQRIVRQQALLKLLADARTHLSAEAAAQDLHNYFQSLSRYRVADVRPELGTWLRTLAEFTASMLNNMTQKQRNHLRERLLEYAADFDALSQ